MSKEKIQNHILVPKHEKLSEKDKKELLEQLGVNLDRLPTIHLKDPAIASLSVKIGDIIKITRIDPTTLNSLYYRVVING